MLILFEEYFKDRQISSVLFYINLQLFLSLGVPASQPVRVCSILLGTLAKTKESQPGKTKTSHSGKDSIPFT